MFNRNCADALDFYSKAFDAKIIEMQKYGDMPPNPAFPIAESDKNLVLHARIEIAGMEIMCADGSEKIIAGDNMYISVTVKDSSMVQKAWDILKQNGKIYMELTPSFFAVLHGSLQDKFGISWMFTVSK
jgi:PhnB protein